MSSRFGQRPVGTDGGDFLHRQQVASHYQHSLTFKFRLQMLCIPHVLILLLVYVKLAEEALDWVGIDLGPLERLQLPDAYLWEWWWALSGLAVPLALVAMPRNRGRVMRWCYYCHFVLGVLPLTAGLGTMTPDIWLLLRRPREDGLAAQQQSFAGGQMPMVVLWFPFFIIAVQIHCFCMYCAAQLVKLWTTKTSTTSATTAMATGQEDDKKTL